MNDETMEAINNPDDYFFCIGRIIYFAQCIENDVKTIYCHMVDSLTDEEEDEVMNEWTLGRTVKELEDLDNSDSDPYLSDDDYKLLMKVTKIRNYCAHECFLEWIYEIGTEQASAFRQSSDRMLKDHNCLARLYRLVEKARIDYCSDS